MLVLDRYEIGERQTSACAAPTGWLEALGLEPSIRQTFGELVLHTPHTTARFPLPWTFSTFDYRTLCELLDEQNEAEFETATVEGRGTGSDGSSPSAPTGVKCRRRWWWTRSAGDACSARRLPAAGRAALARLEVHPGGRER